MRNLRFVCFLTGILMSASLFGQLPTAQQIASKMQIGWNMGNTLEAIGGEQAWGGAYTTQALIDQVKASGFNTVRLPAAWFTHSDTINSVIDAAWIARVKEVVDYCMNNNMYVVLNMHWDKGWLKDRVNEANKDQVNSRLDKYWKQIATYFKDYDEHLLFAGANEPSVKDATGMAVLTSYYQTFINAVRVTGGNNSSRTLIIQGPATDIEKTNNLMNTLPSDWISDRMMVEVHYYTPYQFCLMDKDEEWGKIVYYWGNGYHSSTDTKRNATGGEEDFVDYAFGLMKSKFVDKGIPVIIGEFSASKRDLTYPSDQTLHEASRKYYYKYVVSAAISRGLVPMCWDLNEQIFDRENATVLDQGLIDAMLQGEAAAHVSIK